MTTTKQWQQTNGWKYTLTGFGEFLEMRRVAFADPMPPTRLCGVCGLLPSRTLLLPCGHVLCDSCRDQLPQGNDCCCPFDGKKFVDSDVHPMTIEWCELEQRRIVCSAGSQVCGFSGNLCDLADHLTRCGSGKAKCCKCNRPVFRSHAVSHYRSCTGPLYAANAEVASKTDAAKMADVETSTPNLTPSKGIDLEAELGCFKSALAEKLASLEGQLLEVQKKSSNDMASLESQLLEVQKKSNNDVASLEAHLLEVQKKSSNDVATFESQLLEAQKKSSNDVASLESQLRELQKKSSNDKKKSSVAAATKAAVIQGPYRAASKAGVLITTCKFADIYADLDSLNEKMKELRKSTDVYSLGGYTFMLDCEFSKDENEVKVRFILFLRGGEWDSYVDWPFKKKVTLIIMHIKDAAKDVRLPITMVGHKVVRKPHGGIGNWGNWTIKKNWQDIELQGYVDRGALYVNIEFE
ncbi:hypothetical protein HPB52_021002 [Rhipicephalus sanguineus]|uniref:RING-type domain-containing protein n=1 Tax=Rhipicephalus sanguineus TaxID=34632 RepID=A0A9D4T855_RHISA|nr:hypothetical protein HPB52_021002 [Rhipicephalus sanguineus]